jgi:hypothetical protein
MTHCTSAEAVNGLLDLVEVALSGIEQGGGDSDLRDLRLALFDLTALLQYDAGIKAAGEDLYGISVRIVSDCAAGLQLDDRKLRVLAARRTRLRLRSLVTGGLQEACSSLPA